MPIERKTHGFAFETADQIIAALPSLVEQYSQFLGLVDPTQLLTNDNLFTDTSWSGEGLSTLDALKTLADYHRTRQFIKGIEQAMKTVRKNAPKPIALDAGTGTGVLALAQAVGGCDKVFALEINPHTAKLTKKFIADLGFSGKIEVIECDATNVDLNGLTADILASENLTCGFFDEPQHAILVHLSRYLSPHAPIIPHAYQLYASLASADWDTDQAGVAARTLPSFMKLIPPRLFFAATSADIIEYNNIKGEVLFDLSSFNDTANTLVISAAVQVDNKPSPVDILPDSARGLNQSAAFILPKGIDRSSGVLGVYFDYPFDLPRELATIRQEGNKIRFIGPRFNI